MSRTPSSRTRSGRHQDAGRGVARLVADFGHQLPPLTVPPAAGKDPDPFGAGVGRHGRAPARRPAGHRSRRRWQCIG